MAAISAARSATIIRKTRTVSWPSPPTGHAPAALAEMICGDAGFDVCRFEDNRSGRYSEKPTNTTTPRHRRY